MQRRMQMWEIVIMNNVPFYVDEWDPRLYTILYSQEEANFARFLMCEMPDYLI